METTLGLCLYVVGLILILCLAFWAEGYTKKNGVAFLLRAASCEGLTDFLTVTSEPDVVMGEATDKKTGVRIHFKVYRLERGDIKVQVYSREGGTLLRESFLIPNTSLLPEEG